MTSRRTLLTFVATLFIGLAYGQDWLNDNKNEVKRKILSHLVDTTYKITYSETVAHIEGYDYDTTHTTWDTTFNVKAIIERYEKLEMEYYFNSGGELTGGGFDHFCDSIILKYYCGSCAEKHIKEFISDKDRKWKQIDTDIYISRRKINEGYAKDKATSKEIKTIGSPKMVIKRTPDKPICITVYFTIPIFLAIAANDAPA